MSSIPKRPHASGFMEEWASAPTEYEHAVAKVAVEALKAAEAEKHAASGFDHFRGCKQCEALAKINASGWQP